MKKLWFFLLLLFVINSRSYSQLDNVKGEWPFPPFQSSHGINGAFAEFR
ncbi:hypothetical protein MNBD_IGNAVI01-2699, partial [hydrothermal vent metagenome]